MAKKNVAKGNDRVAVQAGVVHDKDKAPKSGKQARPEAVKNVRSGNATVGAQVDEIRGGLNFTRRR